MQTQLQPYVYQSLSSDYIRLLGLHKRSSQHAFSGTLKTVHIDKAPPYFCLSYTWGTQSEDVEIEIDGMGLCVRPSLVDTLHRLQELAIEEEEGEGDLKVEWVWIDRICINQDDIHERGEQVRCMGTIYAQAVRTIIWAGLDVDGCSAAWTLIDRIYSICRTQNPTAKYLADIPWRIYSDQTHAASGLPPWDDALWSHLRRLFDLPWFTRTWIIQEVALSALDPVILHGHHRYSWEKLGWAASWLRRNGYLRLSQMPDQLQNCDTISNLRRSKARWQLDALLATTSVKFKSTDQRDKIYGLLGLAREIEGGEMPEAMVPDYELEVWQVYTRVVRHFIQSYRSLPTLALASGIWGDKARQQHVHQYELLPSWVPNWSDCSVSNSEHTKGLSWLYYKANGDATTYGFPGYSHAAKEMPAVLLDSEDEAVLRLEGLKVDSVAGVVEYDETSKETERDSVLKAWKMYIAAKEEEGGVSEVEECVIAFVYASTAEQHALSGRSAEQVVKDGAAYLLETLTQDGENESDHGMLDTLKTMSTDGSPVAYASLVKNFCHNRSFILSSSGRIGITHMGTRKGDAVVVLFGGGVPYVVRKVEDHFLFVGEAYIYGLMKGQAVEEWKEGRLEKEVLEFR